MLDPDRNGDGADASSLPFKVGQDPAPLPLLDGLDVKLGQFVPPQGAANQKRQDHVVAFALERISGLSIMAVATVDRPVTIHDDAG